jgi:hypothetical protein
MQGVEDHYEQRATVNDDEPCDECGHRVSLHGIYGCEHERGDGVAPGEGGASGSGFEMALGPCGCQAITFEPEDRDAS